MKVCNKCNQEKDDECFAWKIKAKGIRNSFCKECRNLYTKDHYKRNKSQYLKRVRKYDKKRKKEILEKFLLYLSDKSCKICGESDIRVLEFDHVRGVKVANISTMIRNCMTWDVILTEISKCDVRCANCHRIRTAIQQGWIK